MATSAKMFKVGVVGYGLSAKVFHIPFIALTKNLELHAIVQRRPTDTDSAPKDHPEVKHYESLEPLLRDPEIDLVVLSVPPNTHFSFAKAALESGKHVLVEKPFVPTSAEADQLVALAKQHNRILCVYQNRRWDADFLTVQKLFREGTLGRIYEFETHYDRFRLEKSTTWKGKLTMADGGGVVYDLGVHILDQVYVLFGLPTTVSAKFVNQREGRVVTGADPTDEPDSITAVLSYARTGLLVHVRVAIMSVEKQQLRFWIRGTKGSYHKTGVDPQEDQLKAGLKASDAGFGREDAVWDGRLCLLKDDGSVGEERCPNTVPETYLNLYELLGKAIESGKEQDVPVPATQAADVLRIVEAIRESAEVGKDVTFS